MRQGIPSAGNFLNQELAILTGSIEAMVVDVQCIMQSLTGVADHFHTEIITTSPKVKMTGATHIEFDEHHALDIAKTIVKRACDNYANRGESASPSRARRPSCRGSATSTSTTCWAACTGSHSGR